MNAAENITYSDTDNQTWAILFNRQLDAVKQYAYSNFVPALKMLKLNSTHVPLLTVINQQLLPLTGWTLYPVPGLIENEYFFKQMQQQRFGSTTWLRKPEQLDYLEEPDMFHDIFGHIPLLADKNITDFLSNLARIAAATNFDEVIVEACARLYWYTVEFGLIKEEGKLKIYGAGILSSIGETAYCMSSNVKLTVFNIEEILATPYIKDSFQSQYFVLNSMDDLTDAVVEFEKIASIKIQ